MGRGWVPLLPCGRPRLPSASMGDSETPHRQAAGQRQRAGMHSNAMCTVTTLRVTLATRATHTSCVCTVLYSTYSAGQQRGQNAAHRQMHGQVRAPHHGTGAGRDRPQEGATIIGRVQGRRRRRFSCRPAQGGRAARQRGRPPPSTAGRRLGAWEAKQPPNPTQAAKTVTGRAKKKLETTGGRGVLTGRCGHPPPPTVRWRRGTLGNALGPGIVTHAPGHMGTQRQT